MAGAIVLATYLGLNPPGFAAQVVALAFGLAAATLFPTPDDGDLLQTDELRRGDLGGCWPVLS